MVEAQLRNVEGLVKLLDRAEMKANDWSVTPEDEGFDFEQALRKTHVELKDLIAESLKSMAIIKKAFVELGI